MSNNIGRPSVPSHPGFSPINEQFARGVDLHLNGNLTGAEIIYREILASAATHVGALHLLGVVMFQTKR